MERLLERDRPKREGGLRGCRPSTSHSLASESPQSLLSGAFAGATGYHLQCRLATFQPSLAALQRQSRYAPLSGGTAAVCLQQLVPAVLAQSKLLQSAGKLKITAEPWQPTKSANRQR